jgi:sugar lactone lactonase YvrE
LVAAGCGTAHDAGPLGRPAAGERVGSVSSALTPVRGVANDSWADVVLGKPDFTQIQQYRVVQNLLYIPEGVWIDRSRHSFGTQKMYVDDSGNNRILGYNWDRCIASTTNPLNCTPSIVLGQPNFTSSGCNGDSGFQNWPNRAPASNASLCTLEESQPSVAEGGSAASMVTDAGGTLYVADFWNNRVLKYIDPFATDTIADAVWGQADFTGNACNKGNSAPDATTLCFNWGNNNSWTAGVDLDSSGKLWIADSGNHRILHFPAGSTTADIVIGQTSFTANSEGSGLNQFEDPVAIRFSPKTGNLYVADNGQDNRRVVRFTPPFTTGMSGTLFQTFRSPMGVDIDPSGQGIWITDRNDNLGSGVIELWTEGQVPTKTRQVTSPGDIRLSGGIGIDLAGNMASASRFSNFPQNITVYKTDGTVVPVTSTTSADYPNQVDNGSIGNLKGVEVSGNQLLVADGNRLMVWNSPATLSSGATATYVNTLSVCCVSALKADALGQYVWTVNGNGLFDAGPFSLIAYPLPMGGSLTPAKTINLSQPLALEGGGTIDLSGDLVRGIAADTSGAIWIAASSTSRVLRIRAPLSGTPTVDVVLGQADPNGTLCNRDHPLGFDDISDQANAQPNTLCAPGSVSIDTQGNVWVSDHSIELNGNLRLLEFNAGLFPSSTPTPIYGPSATHVYPQAATFQSAFDSNGNLVEGFNPISPYSGLFQGGSRFSALYYGPLTETAQRPDSYLSDFESFAYAAAFDSQGNFYAGDLDRSRVLVYHGLPRPAGCASGAKVFAVDSCGNLTSFGTTGPVCVKVNLNAVNGWNASNVQGRTVTAQGATTQGPFAPGANLPNQPGLTAGSDGSVYFNFTAGQASYTSMACW